MDHWGRTPGGNHVRGVLQVEGPQAAGRPPPVTFDPAELSPFADLLDLFLTSVGTPLLEVAAIALARAGGVGVERPHTIAALGPDVTKRPWRWFLLGVETAERSGRIDLLTKASAVVGFWQMNVARNLSMADWFAMGLDGCPADVEAAVHAAALRHAPSVDEATVLATDANGDAMTAGLAHRSAELRTAELA